MTDGGAGASASACQLFLDRPRFGLVDAVRHFEVPARVNLIPKSIRYSARMLFKSPGFTAVAVLALGLGIGANTAIFSLADVLLYHPLELPELERVVTVIGTQKGNRKSFDRLSPADYARRCRSGSRRSDRWCLADFNGTRPGENRRPRGSARPSVALRDDTIFPRTFRPAKSR